jgi:hypothetical protein
MLLKVMPAPFDAGSWGAVVRNSSYRTCFGAGLTIPEPQPPCDVLVFWTSFFISVLLLCERLWTWVE